MFSSAAMRAIVADEARLQRMLDVESALARAPRRARHHSQAAAIKPIADACRAEHFDIAALGEAARSAGNVAIPLVKALTAEVKKRDAKAAGYVHWGATSQDIIDTALMLELRAAIDALCKRSRPRDRGLCRARREAPAARRRWRAPGCSRLCRCRSG